MVREEGSRYSRIEKWLVGNTTPGDEEEGEILEDIPSVSTEIENQSGND